MSRQDSKKCWALVSEQTNRTSPGSGYKFVDVTKSIRLSNFSYFFFNPATSGTCNIFHPATSGSSNVNSPGV